MSPAADNPWDLDERAARDAFQRAGRTFATAAFIHAEARDRLLDRLEWVKLAPAVIVDVGCALGEGARLLTARYPSATVLALDSSPAMLRAARQALHGLGPHCLAADARRLPLRAASVDLLFANLLLPWVADFTPVFEEWQRVLKPDGLATFTTVGPDTLYELAQAWATVEDLPHVHGFFDMHDVGDALLRSGLAEPVLDVDHVTVTYPSVEALARDLKACAAQNATVGRRRTLTGPRRWRSMVESYPRSKAPDRIQATVELVFGQAWGRAAVPSSDPGLTTIPVASIKRRR